MWNHWQKLSTLSDAQFYRKVVHNAAIRPQESKPIPGLLKTSCTLYQACYNTQAFVSAAVQHVAVTPAAVLAAASPYAALDRLSHEQIRMPLAQLAVAQG